MKNNALLQLFHTEFLLAGIAQFSLGAGMAWYLGYDFSWLAYLAGQAWVTISQIAILFLGEYFRPAPIQIPDRDQQAENRADQDGSDLKKLSRLPRQSVLAILLTSMAVLASLTVMIIAQIQPLPVVYLLMVTGFGLGFFYYYPPVTLRQSGFGELVHSFTVTFLVTLFAFILLSKDLNRLVAITAFPLALLYLSMLIAIDLPNYASYLRTGVRALIVRLGWQDAMNAHNLLILLAFLSYAAAGAMGLPIFVLLSLLIPLVIGILQIWQMLRISQGNKPNWRTLRLTAYVLYGITVYLLIFLFWTR